MRYILHTKNNNKIKRFYVEDEEGKKKNNFIRDAILVILHRLDGHINIK